MVGADIKAGRAGGPCPYASPPERRRGGGPPPFLVSTPAFLVPIEEALRQESGLAVLAWFPNCLIVKSVKPLSVKPSVTGGVTL